MWKGFTVMTWHGRFASETEDGPKNFFLCVVCNAQESLSVAIAFGDAKPEFTTLSRVDAGVCLLPSQITTALYRCVCATCAFGGLGVCTIC